MGQVKDQAAALKAAFGYRKYLILPIIGAVVGYVDWVAAKLDQVGLSNLVGIPSWAIGLFVALGAVAYRLLDYIVELRGLLAPKIRTSFEADKGGLSLTPLTDN